MKRLTIGIVDYGAGNLTSVKQSLHSMGYRARITHDIVTLDQADVLLLPGVGAFPAAMASLHKHGLADYLISKAHQGKPLIGICLGMQLLTDCSHEISLTNGLGLISGEVVPLPQANWHIGWNNIEIRNNHPMLMTADNSTVYFNHSFVVQTQKEYCAGITCIDNPSEPLTTIIKRNNVVGLQFHPEKSQLAGRQILASVIEGVCHA
jgi:glutamine amidotransferase